MPGLKLKVGSKTKKGTVITQKHVDAVASDEAGIEVIQDNSKLIVRQIGTALARAMEKVGIKAEGDVVGYMTKEYIVDTGRLRNSITHAVVDNGKAAAIGTNVEYALYVHEGTSKMNGRPYLTDPVQQNKDDYRKIIEGELKNGGSGN